MSEHRRSRVLTGVPQAGHAVDLSFGASSVVPEIPPVLGALRIVLPPPSAALRLTFSANVDRKLTGSADLGWQQTGRATADRQTVPWSQPGQLRVAQGLPIRQALRQHGLTAAPFEQNSRQLISSTCPWVGTSIRRNEFEDAYQGMSSVRVDRETHWQVTNRFLSVLQENFVSLLPLPRRETLSWVVATFEAWCWQQQFAKAENKAWHARIPWQTGRSPPPGESLLPVVPPDPQSRYCPLRYSTLSVRQDRRGFSGCRRCGCAWGNTRVRTRRPASFLY